MRSVVAVVVSCIVLVTGVAGAGATTTAKANKLPKDACALLTDAQVSTLVPSATAKPQPPGANYVSCAWLGTGSNLALSVYKVKAAKAKSILKSATKQSHGKAVKGIGTYAYSSATSFLAHVGAVVGTLQISVDFTPGHAPTAADTSQAVSIAKTVAKEL